MSKKLIPQVQARAGKRPDWYHIGPVLALAADPPSPDAAPDAAPKPKTSADVYVFDDIGGWFGLTADDFVRDVSGLDVDQLVLHLNTRGGDALEGVAIANVLRAHKAHVVVRVDGLAASAGSVIAMAGDEVVMGIGSEMMIHDPWGMVMGDVEDILAFGRQLSTTGDALASTYAARTGGTIEDWRAVMKAETWYTAEEAVSAGLADRVAAADEKGTAEGEQVTPGGSNGLLWDMWDSLKRPDRFDLSVFNYAGRAQAPAPSAAPRMNQIREGNSAVDFTDDQLTQMRESLGLGADATADDIVTALANRSTEASTDSDTEPAQDAPTAPSGVVTVDAEVLASLRNQAALGVQAHQRQLREDRERLVSAAVEDGRIAPARREHWLKALEADSGAAATLAALEPGLVPVGQAMGHAGDPEVDQLYAAVFGDETGA